MSDQEFVNHNISITDVISTAGWESKGNSAYRGSHPVHGSGTGNNTVVDTTENAGYCFRCKSGGGPLLWIALEEGIISSCDQMGSGALKGKEFIETCKIANEKYGANIDIDGINEEELDKRQEVRQVLEKAGELTHGQLQQDDTRWERIKNERSLDDETIEEVKIGYWNETVTETLKNRFTVEALVNSGLFKINCPDQDCQKSFKNLEDLEEHTETKYSKEHLYPIVGSRVTFPYRRYGRTLYFIGRRTKEQEDHWYEEVEDNIQEVNDEILNNSDTIAETLDEAKDNWVSRKCGKYIKICETNYNEHIIWQEVKDREELVITEGIYDAISVHKAGYSVASPITTRFNSKDQDKIVEIAKEFETVHLVFDGDTAGKEGQQETAQELTRKGVEPNLVTLEPGKDLDDWTNENGYKIRNLLDEEGERYLDTFINRYNKADGRERVQIKEKIFKTITEWKEREAEWVFSDMDGNAQDFKKQWRKVKDEVREQKEREEKRKQLPDKETQKEEEDEGITDVLEVPESDKELHINPRPSVYVNQLMQTATETHQNQLGTVDKEPLFKVYEVQFGEGNEEDTWKLLVEPWRKLTLGENNLPIKKADLSNPGYKNSDYFRDKYKETKREIEGFSKTYGEWLESQEGSEYIELQDRIDQRSKSIVKEMCNDTILELLLEYLQAGYYVDPKLRTVMYPQFIQHHKSQVKPGNVAKYQPHTQMWTNTKVGKSKTAQRVGRKIDETSTAGLLGYADTDGKQAGQIDGLEVPVFLDEFNFGNSSERLNDKLLPLLEEGYFEQTKAGHSVKTRFYGNFSYLANPQESDIPEQTGYEDKKGLETYGGQDRAQFELVSQFEELIDLLGMNIQAMASRFGVVVFDETMDRAEPFEGQQLSDKRFDKLEAFAEWIRTTVSREYTLIETEMSEWLEQEYEESYKERIRELAKNTSNERVEKFWKNHIHSYRHARGQALRMAVFQHIGNVVKGDYDSSDMREEAEKQWETVKEINMESLENMTDATDEEQEISRARSKVDSYSPKYLRLFTKTVIKYHQEQDESEVGKIKVFDELKDVFSELKHELPDKDVNPNSKYWNWSEVASMVSDNLNSKRSQVSNDFGVELFRRSQEEMFRVKVPARFKNFYKLDIPEVESVEDEESSESEGDDSLVGEEQEEEEVLPDQVLIEGKYYPREDSLIELFKENEDKYPDREIPQKHLVKNFGRHFDGRKQDKLKKKLKSMSRQGAIRDGPSGSEQTWIRAKGSML